VEIDESTIESYLDVIYKKLAWLPREELIKRFVSVEFNRFLSYYKNAPDLNVAAQRPKNKEKKQRPSKMDFTRFHINLGSKNKLSIIDLISLINKHTGDQSIEIGKIEILNNFSFFEIDKDYETLILSAFKNVRRDGIKLKVEVSRSKGKGEMTRDDQSSRKTKSKSRRSDESRKNNRRGQEGRSRKSKGKKKFR
jgi:ATP-dependent RNA helicase DeaD